MQPKLKYDIIKALADPLFIQTLLDLYDRVKGIVQECFSHDSLFQKNTQRGFRCFLRPDGHRRVFCCRSNVLIL